MKTLLTPYQIRAGVLSITEKLMTRHNSTTPIVMIGVMRGGFMFYNDLVREMQNYNVICDFVNCKSYDGVENTGFKMLLDSRVDVTDKHVYLVDDILDSGITYEYLKVHYEYKNPLHHHHHIICKTCKNVELIEDCILDQIEFFLSKKGYANLEHKLEFFGTCKNCLAA
jgi:hypoxanthine phosphoribosyltransferase